MFRNYNQYESKTINFGISPIGEFEGWYRFYHFVYSAGKPEDFRSCVVKGLR